MKTVIYKTPIEYYECAEISDDGGNEVRFIFDKPIDGKLAIGNGIYTVSRGVCRASAEKLPEGEVRPKLYTGGRTLLIEGFICRGGALVKKTVGEEYARRLGEKYAELAERVGSLEKEVGTLGEKITQKINF